ncbi:unnamed protein product [Onchocerca flexuosa]|uniref:Neur_chan_LBD domain-containing protein n=1 Tax=Onchocerca flexuosa TaxID=387005 RepID=A0A183HR82_9BILA|nr:unnamed protein product [Onchocerca flexuosa]
MNPIEMIISNFYLLYIFLLSIAYCNKDASRLLEDLLFNYNKLVRPINNKTNPLVVYFKLKLSQLLDVHEKNQIMTTNVWLQHVLAISCLNLTKFAANLFCYFLALMKKSSIKQN